MAENNKDYDTKEGKADFTMSDGQDADVGFDETDVMEDYAEQKEKFRPYGKGFPEPQGSLNVNVPDDSNDAKKERFTDEEKCLMEMYKSGDVTDLLFTDEDTFKTVGLPYFQSLLGDSMELSGIDDLKNKDVQDKICEAGSDTFRNDICAKLDEDEALTLTYATGCSYVYGSAVSLTDIGQGAYDNYLFQRNEKDNQEILKFESMDADDQYHFREDLRRKYCGQDIKKIMNGEPLGFGFNQDGYVVTDDGKAVPSHSQGKPPWMQLESSTVDFENLPYYSKEVADKMSLEDFKTQYGDSYVTDRPNWNGTEMEGDVRIACNGTEYFTFTDGYPIDKSFIAQTEPDSNGVSVVSVRLYEGLNFPRANAFGGGMTAKELSESLQPDEDTKDIMKMLDNPDLEGLTPDDFEPDEDNKTNQTSEDSEHSGSEKSETSDESKHKGRDVTSKMESITEEAGKKKENQDQDSDDNVPK